jgi:hypothetical protein
MERMVDRLEPVCLGETVDESVVKPRSNSSLREVILIHTRTPDFTSFFSTVLRVTLRVL